MNTSISSLLERKGFTVHAVAPTMTVTEAVDEMNRHRIGCIVVLEDGRLAGIFTERDVLRRVVGESLDPKRAQVKDVMTASVITITPETMVDETMTLFLEKRCRHLPVMQDGRLVGLISIGDVSRWLSDSHRVEAEHLKNYITGGFPV